MIYGILTKEQAVTFMEEGRSIWACAYELDPRTKKPKYRCSPVEGSFYQGRRGILFGVHGKRGHVGNGVDFRIRRYADTREEAMELYERMVNEERARYGLPKAQVLRVYDQVSGRLVRQPERVEAFFDALDQLSRRYGFSIASDEGLGMVLEPYSKENMEELRKMDLSLGNHRTEEEREES